MLCVSENRPHNEFKIIGRCQEFNKDNTDMYIWLDMNNCRGGNSNVSNSFKDTQMNLVVKKYEKLNLSVMLEQSIHGVLRQPR